jgi:peptide/nickel transport system permease protein
LETATSKVLPSSRHDQPVAGESQERSSDSRKGGWFSERKALAISGGVIATIVGLGLLAPIIAPSDPTLTVSESLRSPSWTHPFGTDEFGRDILSRILFGLRISVEIALITAVVAGIIGTTAGLYAGYFAGWRDSLISRSADFLLGWPALIAAMLVVAIFGASTLSPTIAAILITIPLFARVVRGSVLAERSKEYVTASRALGGSSSHVLFRTLLPSVLPVVYVQAAIAASLAIQLEAGLSFLGLGVPPPNPSLGGMLFASKGFLYNSPMYAVFPGIAITIVVGALIVFANALEARESVDLGALARRAEQE